jgi:hypothetical protein
MLAACRLAGLSALIATMASGCSRAIERPVSVPNLGDSLPNHCSEEGARTHLVLLAPESPLRGS